MKNSLFYASSFSWYLLKYLFLIRLSCPRTARDVLHGILFVKERKAILGRIPSIFFSTWKEAFSICSHREHLAYWCPRALLMSLQNLSPYDLNADHMKLSRNQAPASIRNEESPCSDNHAISLMRHCLTVEFVRSQTLSSYFSGDHPRNKVVKICQLLQTNVQQYAMLITYLIHGEWQRYVQKMTSNLSEISELPRLAFCTPLHFRFVQIGTFSAPSECH